MKTAACALLASGAAVAFSAAPPPPLASGPIDPPAGAGAMGPNVALAGDGVLLTWLEPVEPRLGKGHRLRFSRLSGDLWSPPVTIASGPALLANWADFPGAVQAPDGSLVAHWLEKTGPEAYGIKLARSVDGGATWLPAGALNGDETLSEHGFVSWVPEGDGVRGFWLDGRGLAGKTEKEGAMALRTAMVRGKTVGQRKATDEVGIDSRVCSCCQTDAALAAGGSVIAYRDRTADEVRDIAVIRRTPQGWSQPTRVHADNWKIPGCPVNGPALAAAGRHVAVAWFTAAPPNPRIQVAFSEDGGATFGDSTVVDGGKPIGRVDVALDANGDALVSWLAADATDASGAGASVRLRRITPKGKLGAPLLVAATSAARNSGFPRLVRVGDRLVMAWVEAGEPSKVRAAAVPVSAIRLGAPPTPPPPTPKPPSHPAKSAARSAGTSPPRP